MKVYLFSVITCLGILSVVFNAEAIPWFSEEDKSLGADSIAVGRIMSYRDDGAHRYYEVSIIKWITNPQPDRIITMKSIAPKAFNPADPFFIFEKKDLGLFYLKSVDNEWHSTNFSKQIWASDLSQTIYDMKKLVGNNNPDSAVSLERLCKEGYVNAVKNRTGEIACVKPQTLQKLIERGWATYVKGNIFPYSVKHEVLTQLQKGPQNVNGTAQAFVVFEALADKQVWDLLKDTKFQINCCTYTSVLDEYPYKHIIGITFGLPQKDVMLSVGYDLQEEKITSVEVRDYIRGGSGVVSFESKESEKESFVKITLDGFKHAQSVGNPLDDFTIKLEGYYPTYNSPDIILIDERGNTVWTNYDDIGHVYFGRTTPTEFCKEYKFSDVGGPLTINKTGTYRLIFSFEGFSMEQELLIMQSAAGVTLDSSNFHCN